MNLSGGNALDFPAVNFRSTLRRFGKPELLDLCLGQIIKAGKQLLCQFRALFHGQAEDLPAKFGCGHCEVLSCALLIFRPFRQNRWWERLLGKYWINTPTPLYFSASATAFLKSSWPS